MGSSAASAAVIEVDERSFQAQVLERSRSVPVVVDFWAPWCGPCRVLGPILEKLAKESNGAWVLAKINVDNNQRLAQMFRVQGIPAVKAFRDGKLADQFEGALPESQVRAWLNRLLPAEQNDPLAAARELEDRAPDEAAARYRLALGQNPDDHDALLGVGRLLVQQGEAEGAEALKQVPANSPHYAAAQGWLALAEFFGEARNSKPDALAAQVAAQPGDIDARYKLAALQARNRRYDDAIEQLLAIVGRNRAFREDGARKMLLALFAVLGDQHPLVAPARRKLANLLF
ncbi:thioredoxin [Kouleothrix aurantiaca]|uniref:Thioredoxin n=1 Tax=Kouleothrix aurantiaca TaxID=186479 RepID=A0A0P9HBN9_9CHLR|nr:thioredoxin [Kouleothrix aurantiaca]